MVLPGSGYKEGEVALPMVQTIPDGLFELYCFVIRACWRFEALSQVRNTALTAGTPLLHGKRDRDI
jgi:hypothetical protein